MNYIEIKNKCLLLSMKPNEEKIVIFDSCSYSHKVGKRNSVMQEEFKGSLAFKHRNSSFRYKQSDINVANSLCKINSKIEKSSTRLSDIPKQLQDVENKTAFTTQSVIITPIKKNSEDLYTTPEKKPSIGIPHLKQRKTTSTSKVAPIAIISPEECLDVMKKMEKPIQTMEIEKQSDIQSYCAPNPFANFDQEELEKMVANIKMPESKNAKSNFRKIYKEHVIQTLQSICLIKTIKRPSDEEINSKILKLTMPLNSNALIRNKNRGI